MKDGGEKLGGVWDTLRPQVSKLGGLPPFPPLMTPMCVLIHIIFLYRYDLYSLYENTFPKDFIMLDVFLYQGPYLKNNFKKFE